MPAQTIENRTFDAGEQLVIDKAMSGSVLRRCRFMWSPLVINGAEDVTVEDCYFHGLVVGERHQAVIRAVEEGDESLKWAQRQGHNFLIRGATGCRFRRITLDGTDRGLVIQPRTTAVANNIFEAISIRHLHHSDNEGFLVEGSTAPFHDNKVDRLFVDMTDGNAVTLWGCNASNNTFNDIRSTDSGGILLTETTVDPDARQTGNRFTNVRLTRPRWASYQQGAWRLLRGLIHCGANATVNVFENVMIDDPCPGHLNRVLSVDWAVPFEGPFPLAMSLAEGANEIKGFRATRPPADVLMPKGFKGI